MLEIILLLYLKRFINDIKGCVCDLVLYVDWICIVVFDIMQLSNEQINMVFDYVFLSFEVLVGEVMVYKFF